MKAPRRGEFKLSREKVWPPVLAPAWGPGLRAQESIGAVRFGLALLMNKGVRRLLRVHGCVGGACQSTASVETLAAAAVRRSLVEVELGFAGAVDERGGFVRVEPIERRRRRRPGKWRSARRELHARKDAPCDVGIGDRGHHAHRAATPKAAKGVDSEHPLQKFRPRKTARACSGRNGR